MECEAPWSECNCWGHIPPLWEEALREPDGFFDQGYFFVGHSWTAEDVERDPAGAYVTIPAHGPRALAAEVWREGVGWVDSETGKVTEGVKELTWQTTQRA